MDKAIKEKNDVLSKAEKEKKEISDKATREQENLKKQFLQYQTKIADLEKRVQSADQENQSLLSA